MKRPAKIALISVGTILGLLLAAYVAIIWTFLSGGDRQTAGEVTINPEYIQRMKSAGYPISINRAFEASSYGGWHGDGASVKAYRFSSSEGTALVAALKARHPDYSWTEMAAKHVTLGHLKKLLPVAFLPSSGSVLLREGRPTQGYPVLEYVICPSEGLLYIIRHQF